MNSKISKILNAARTFWSKAVYPALKIGKPYLRRWAWKVLIPHLKNNVNAGAVDKAVDAIIEKSVLDAIDIL